MESIFEYEALVASGESINGVYKGDRKSFEKMVAQKKIILISVDEKKEKLDSSKFSQNDFLDFIEELYYLVNSGMPIDKSLKMLLKTTKKEAQIKILNNILQGLKDGQQLSVSLAKALEKDNFQVDSLSISFISTAEDVGNLSNGLFQLFEYLSFKKKIRSDIRQALAYPLFLMGMSVVVSFLIFFLIIPKFATIFSPEEFEKLPSLSYAVLSLGQSLNNHMFEALLSIVFIVLIAIYTLRTVSIPWLDIMYKIPKVSAIVIDLQLTIIYSTLSTMLKGGLELDRALIQMKKIQLLPELSNLLQNTLFELKRGEKMSTVFSISRIIPSSDLALINVGENSATLDTVFKSLSKRHSDAFDENVKKFLSLLEPAVIVGLGIFIAIIVVSIMMAVMSMTDIAG